MKRATYLLVLCVGALLALGMVMLYSSSMVQHGAGLLASQLKWCVLGLLAGAVALGVDYRILKRGALPWLLYAVAVGLLVLVLIPGIGEMKNGARRWFVFGGQPSELAKIALIVALAFYAEKNGSKMRGLVRGLVLPGLMIGTMLVLVFLEPDWGTAMLITAVGGIMLVISGVRWLHVMPLMLAGIVVLGFLLWENPVRRDRVMAFLHPEEYRDTTGYQTYQAKLALGSGGWTGQGLGNGRQKLGFVPEHHTDFILSIIGEELGLAATLGVLLGFTGIIFCGCTISAHAPDVFGRLMASGITFLIGLQAFINIGVVTGSLPNKGISLPFISYGGSNLVVMLVAVGLLLNIARVAARISPAERKLMGNENVFASEYA